MKNYEGHMHRVNREIHAFFYIKRVPFNGIKNYFVMREFSTQWKCICICNEMTWPSDNGNCHLFDINRKMASMVRICPLKWCPSITYKIHPDYHWLYSDNHTLIHCYMYTSEKISIWCDVLNNKLFE